MDTEKSRALGGAWLCEAFGLNLINPLPVKSQIGSRRHTTRGADDRTEVYQESMRPDESLRAHLIFHLKHEVVHLELLSRVFSQCNQADLETWINNEPTSQYARRCGFLYEWLTGKQLRTGPVGGNYVDALDANDLVVSASAISVKRWLVRDNLPGTPSFCPIVRLTDQAKKAMDLDCAKLLEELKVEFGEEMLMKSAVWLTLRESKSSFQIEGEVDKSDRIQRFADVLHHQTGRGQPPLDNESLAMLQAAILGSHTSLHENGLRKSPVFIGQVVRYQEVIHYVGPPFEDVPAMLGGLSSFLTKTASLSPVMRSAVASFGFVYIHPLADGNGRVHRFLINDILRRDGVVPDPMIIPVSGLIAKNERERLLYDGVLDTFSRPFMDAFKDACSLNGESKAYADHIVSNFYFTGNESARHAWRFMDLTKHVEYLSDVLERTIKLDMREESNYLRSHYSARLAIKDILEMPDSQIDRVIRSVEASQGVLSGVLGKEIPALTREGVWDDIVAAVRSSFKTASPPTLPKSRRRTH